MSKHIDADELRNIILADKEKLFKLRNTCISLSDEEVNDCQSYIYGRVLGRMSECFIEDCPAEIEAMKGKFAQAMELLELAVGDLFIASMCKNCLYQVTCDDQIHWGAVSCTKWQWQHADKFAELKGEL